jgi:hypothetical protein
MVRVALFVLAAVGASASYIQEAIGLESLPRFSAGAKGAAFTCPGYGSYASPLKCPQNVVDPNSCDAYCAQKCSNVVQVWGRADPGGVCQCRYEGGNDDAVFEDQTGVCIMPSSFIPKLSSNCFSELQENLLMKVIYAAFAV